MTIWIIEMYKVVYRKCINIPLFPYKSCHILDDPFHIIWMSKQMFCHGVKTYTHIHTQSQPSPKNMTMISSEAFSFWTWNHLRFIIKWDTKRISTYKVKWKLLSCVWLFFFLLKDNRFTKFWCFLSNLNMNQP